jgi:hypothetical protein
MSLAIASPRLVRILDPNSNPIDVWVDEFSFCLGKYLRELEAQNESDQQVNEIYPSEYYSSGLFRHSFLYSVIISVQTVIFKHNFYLEI